MSLRPVMRRLRFSIECLALLAVLISPAHAATNVVTTLADSGPGSLRWAISNALSGDTIIFATNGTITLMSGELFITNNLNIIGPDASNLVLSGSGLSRVFNFDSNMTCELRGVTIRDGQTTNGFPATSAGVTGQPGGSGGGIFNAGSLTLSDCTIANNRTGDGGVSGDGLGNGVGTSWSVDGNRGILGGSGGSGAGIYNSGTLFLSNCVIVGNTTGSGGQGGKGANGIRGSFGQYGAAGAGGIGGTGGSAGFGGGICNRGTMKICACIIIGNSTGTGGPGGNPGTNAQCQTGDGYCGVGYNGTGGAGGSGAAVCSETGSTTIVFSSTFESNICGGGRGGVNGADAHGGSFSDFVGQGGAWGGAGGSGGGLYNEGLLTISNCLFGSNVSGSGATGGNGGKGADGGSGLTRFSGSGGAGGSGGSGGHGGAVQNFGTASIDNCLLISNTAGNGAAGGNGGNMGICQLYCGAKGRDGSGADGGQGGGVSNEGGTMNIASCAFAMNVGGNGARCGTNNLDDTFPTSGRAGGGGLGNNGFLNLSTSVISNNSAGVGWGQFADGGGGLFNASTAIVYACTFSSNQAYYGGYYGYGGGIVNTQSLTVSNCTFAGNVAANGGGISSISSIGTFNVFGSTFSGNRAGSGGGGIYGRGELRIVACTIASNYSPSSLSRSVSYSGNAAFVRNSVIPDVMCCGLRSEGHNLSSNFDNSASGDIRGTPLLGPLTNNGGSTLTHALLPGSPAIDAGDDTLTGTDQRGYPRRSGAHVDIGAFEFQTPMPQNPTWRKLTNGTSEFTFTTFSDASFSVLATTNVSLPSTQWFTLGPATLLSNGVYQFTDPAAANYRHRFFELRWQ